MFEVPATFFLITILFILIIVERHANVSEEEDFPEEGDDVHPGTQGDGEEGPRV